MKKSKWVLLLPALALLVLLLGPPVQAAGAPRAVLNAKDGVVRIFCEVEEGTASGSGFLISNDDSGALVVTNYHVVEGGTDTVLYYDGNGPIDLTVIAISEGQDLCLLQAPKALPGMAPLALADKVEIGEAVYALGYPGGSDAFSDDLALTKDEMALTSGLVSALPRSHQVGDQSSEVRLVQINADINPGNSGGPLLNESGKVIGVNAMGVDDDTITGINAAIHVDELRSFLQENDVQYAVTSGADFTWSVLAISGLVIALLVLAIWGVTKGEKKAAPPAAPAPQGWAAPVQPPKAQEAAPAAVEESEPNEQLDGQLGLFEEAAPPKPAAAAAVAGSPAILAPAPPMICQKVSPAEPLLQAGVLPGVPGTPDSPGVTEQTGSPLVAPMPPMVGAGAPANGFAPGDVQAPGLAAPLPPAVPYGAQGQPVAPPAAKRPPSRGKKILLIAATCAGVLLLFVTVYGMSVDQKVKSAFEAKNYTAVLDSYEKSPWIKIWLDPRQQPYCEGMLLMKQGKYAAGLKKLQGLNGYADSEKAEIYVRAMNSDSARRQYVDFDSLGDYLDSVARTRRAAEKCYYAAEEFLIQGDFDSAEIYLENVLGTYKNTAQYKKLIQQAKHIDSPPECYAFSESCYEMGFDLPPEIGKYYLEYFMVGDWVAQNGWEYFSLHVNQWDTNFKFNLNHDSIYMHDFGFYDEQEGGTPFVEIEIVNYKEIILRYWGYTKYMYRT